MSNENRRSKEVWLIPKRSNLHQTICLIDGIKERKYDGKTWNPQKQNNLGVNLKKWGATRDGRNISNQSIRTLLALPQYLGFLYIDDRGDTNILRLTQAGEKLYNENVDRLITLENLVVDKDKTIKESEVVKEQLEKLQITNPIILKDCENIFVFPFRIALKILLEVDYLDREEIGYFLFQIKDESEIDLKIEEIKQFRKLAVAERSNIINKFKETNIGNITLVQAPSASYFETICTMSGLVEQKRLKKNNMEKTKSAIVIKDDKKDYIEHILNEKYNNISAYNFQDNLTLWIEYIGNPDRIYTPIDLDILNTGNSDILLKIKKDEYYIYADLIEKDKSLKFHFFPYEDYILEAIDINNGKLLGSKEITPMYDDYIYEVKFNIDHVVQENKYDIVNKIKEHSEASNFAGAMQNYLLVLEKNLGIDKLNDKSLRGGYYEYLFYKLLKILNKENLIDDVIWNGNVGKYGLPNSAPGGKLGTPDLIFIIEDNHYILELTTIKSKSGQERAEVASVPDHIKLYKKDLKTDEKVIGIFVAPMIHSRNVNVMNSILEEAEIDFLALEDNKFMDLLLKSNNKKELIYNLSKIDM